MGGEGKKRATNCVRPPNSFPFQAVGMMRDTKLARTVKKQTVLRDILRDRRGNGGDPRGRGDTYANKEPNFRNSSAGLHLPPCI